MSETVERTIASFANCFDRKDWAGLEALLTDEVELDYAALRGEVGIVPRAAYVARRESALAALATHHLLGNLEVAVAGDAASCRASGMIWRRQGERTFDSHVLYDFRLVRSGGAWRIAAIRQAVLWSDGDPLLHSGARAGR